MFTGAIPQDHVATTDESFADLGLGDDTLGRLDDVGFEHPTPIQTAVIPDAIDGYDLVGLAMTGSGKTAAFCLPMIEVFAEEGHGVRGLILSPTREIALQTKAFVDVFMDSHDLACVCLIGGVPIPPQIRTLKGRPDIIVATPGRLLDHAQRGNVRLDGIEILVLDEADHMLDLGFLPQIRKILNLLPKDRQSLMFSATMPGTIKRLVNQFLRDPKVVDLRPDSRTAHGIEHRLYLIEEEDKKRCALALLHAEEGTTLVFTRRKIDAEWLAKVLVKEGVEVERIHGDRSQKHRVQALQGLRQGHHRVLVATDVAARGIDIPIIEHIINFDMPETVEDYIHRAGRTARGSREGTVSSIGTWRDKPLIKEIEMAINQPLPRHVAEGVEAYEELNQFRPRTGISKGKKRIRRKF